MNKFNILHISLDFNYSCGVSKHIYLLLRELKKDPNFNLFFIANGGDSINRIEILGVKPQVIKFYKGWKNILFFVPNYFKLKNYCINNKISIIHSHHRYPEFLAWLVAKKLGIKTITTVHSFVKGKFFFSFKSHKIISVSKAVNVYLIEHFSTNKEKLIMLHNFVVTDERHKSTDNNTPVFETLTSHDKVLLFLGRINKIKGVDILIDTFLSMSKKRKDVFLVLVGNFDLSESYLEIIRSHQRIILHHSKSSVSEYFHICTVVILPSRIDPFPYVMLESGLFKKPFIGGNTGGIAEFIEDGKNGLLVEPGNVESLTGAIEWVLDNPEEARQLGENLHKKVLTLNSKKEYIEKLIGIYNELLSSE
ncbi:MAG: glycosyltransferase family 4 protein [Ignavibacteriaceae bacterium]